MSLAPIIFFAYNRPEHTQKALESLFENDLAYQSVLYIFADGAKPNATHTELNAIAKTRKILQEKKWVKNTQDTNVQDNHNQIYIIESQSNKGLANSIMEGVTEVLAKHGKAIVLEDDLLLSKGFLKFMNEALEMYENTPQVMHISGYVLPIDASELDESTFFYSQTSCWGWATWKRAWDFLETDAQKLANEIQKMPEGVYQFNMDGTHQFFQALQDNISGKLKTWAIKWQASVFLQNGLALHPTKSLVNNIGNDGTGEHKGFTNKYLHKQKADSIAFTPIAVQESEKAKTLIKKFYENKIPHKSLIPITLRKKIAALLPQKLKLLIMKILVRKY
jgi:hypothetical protein